PSSRDPARRSRLPGVSFLLVVRDAPLLQLRPPSRPHRALMPILARLERLMIGCPLAWKCLRACWARNRSRRRDRRSHRGAGTTPVNGGQALVGDCRKAGAPAPGWVNYLGASRNAPLGEPQLAQQLLAVLTTPPRASQPSAEDLILHLAPQSTSVRHAMV